MGGWVGNKGEKMDKLDRIVINDKMIMNEFGILKGDKLYDMEYNGIWYRIDMCKEEKVIRVWNGKKCMGRIKWDNEWKKNLVKYVIIEEMGILKLIKNESDLISWEIMGIKMLNKDDKFVIELLENDGIYLEICVNDEYEEIEELMVGIGKLDGINWVYENKCKILEMCKEFVNDGSNWYNEYRKRCK